MRRYQRALADRLHPQAADELLPSGLTKYQRRTRVGRRRRLSVAVAVAATVSAIAAPACALVSGSAPTATIVFADGFESGSLSSWTTSAGMTVQSSQVYEGAFAARATSTGTPAYAQKALAHSGYDVVYEGRIDVLSQSSSAGFSLVRLRTSAGAPIMSVFRRNNGRLQTYNEVTGVSTTSATAFPSGWHDLQVHVTVAGTAGSYDISLDGNRVADLSTQANTGTAAVGRVYIGDPASNRAFDVAFDSQTVAMFDSSTASTTAATDTTVATIAPSKTTTVAPTTVPLTTSAPSTVLVPAAPGGSVHVVSTSGSDANAGTEAAPWRTFTRALPALTPGDALYARGGTYVERVNPTLVPASPTAPVLVAAYPGERPVVQGILWLHSPDYWTFDGINVTWDPATGQPNEHMVKITDGTDWTWQNSEVWGAHSYADMLVAGTVTGQPARWRVTQNCIHDTYPTNSTNQDHNLYVNTGETAGSGLIDHNLFYNATNGEGVKVGGADFLQGSANVTVDHNTIWNSAQNVLIAWTTHDTLVTGNILDKVGTNYGNVRGYQLTGTNDVARGNVGFAAKTFILNYDGGLGVTDGGGNLFPVDPQFDSTASCAGFHALNPAVAGYGR